jgi:hypothetical protein
VDKPTKIKSQIQQSQRMFSENSLAWHPTTIVNSSKHGRALASFELKLTMHSMQLETSNRKLTGSTVLGFKTSEGLLLLALGPEREVDEEAEPPALLLLLPVALLAPAELRP